MARPLTPEEIAQFDAQQSNDWEQEEAAIAADVDRLMTSQHCWAQALAQKDAKVGQTLRIRLPNDFTKLDGPSDSGASAMLGGPRLQALMQQAAQDQARHEETLRKRPSGHHVAIPADQQLTRLDIATGQRVPVTQEWINEAVAEIVRLNEEIELRNGWRAIMAAAETNQFLDALPFPSSLMERIAGLVDLEPDTTEQDRIWEAVRAASAV